MCRVEIQDIICSCCRKLIQGTIFYNECNFVRDHNARIQSSNRDVDLVQDTEYAGHRFYEGAGTTRKHYDRMEWGDCGQIHKREKTSRKGNLCLGSCHPATLEQSLEKLKQPYVQAPAESTGSARLDGNSGMTRFKVEEGGRGGPSRR
jgi:hypothetical protein